jgi:hypothetical protein
LAELSEKSPGTKSIRKIYIACRQFVDSIEFLSGAEFYIAVGALRIIVAEQIATLSAVYMVEFTDR